MILFYPGTDLNYLIVYINYIRTYLQQFPIRTKVTVGNRSTDFGVSTQIVEIAEVQIVRWSDVNVTDKQNL